MERFDDVSSFDGEESHTLGEGTSSFGDDSDLTGTDLPGEEVGAAEDTSEVGYDFDFDFDEDDEEDDEDEDEDEDDEDDEDDDDDDRFDFSFDEEEEEDEDY